MKLGILGCSDKCTLRILTVCVADTVLWGLIHLVLPWSTLLGVVTVVFPFLVFIFVFAFLVFLVHPGQLLALGPRGGAVFPSGLLESARLFLALDPREHGGAAIFAVEKIVDFLGQVLPGELAVLGAGAGFLALDDDAGGEVPELDGGAGLVLWGREVGRGLVND